MQKIEERTDLSDSRKKPNPDTPETRPLRFWEIVKYYVSVGTQAVPITGTVVGFFMGILIAAALTLNDNLDEKEF